MEKARVHGPHGWTWRFPDSTRRWIRRWLEVRGAGRARGNPKSFRAEDWVLDSCIALEVAERASRRLVSPEIPTDTSFGAGGRPSPGLLDAP
jgi:hypothetical protein